ncbi:2-C-methyl-D-erythritol 4-phosphate cytidylyltransferase [Gordonia sinesedis]
MSERLPAAVIVPAAGAGVRLGELKPKAFVELADGRSMLETAIDGVRASDVASQIIVVVPDDLVEHTRALLPDVTVVAGGAHRSESVRAGIAACDPDIDLILVHDAARPLTPPDVFTTVVDAVSGGRAVVVPGIPVVDTLKQVVLDDPPSGEPPSDQVSGERVVTTVDRELLRAIQTPQGFRRDALLRAHADDSGLATDDAGLAERCGIDVHVIAGSALAFKITTPFDLTVARAVLDDRATSRMQR